MPHFFWSHLDRLKTISEPIHQLCLSVFESSSKKSVHQALICGKNLSNQQAAERALKTTAIAVGIYHVLVVSGAHLTFLERVLSAIKTPSWLVKWVLFLFALMAHWDPPVVRALFESILRSYTQNSWLSVFLSYLFSIALHPQWIHSSSLLLSLAARSALELPIQGRLKQSFLTSLFLWPLIHSWSPMQFTLILLNVLTAELSLAVWLFSVLTFLATVGSQSLFEILGLKTTWVPQALPSLAVLGSWSVDILHLGLNSLSRWQPHEMTTWFRISQRHYFAYAALLLLTTGVLSRASTKIKLSQPNQK
jgi:hypothetical protein